MKRYFTVTKNNSNLNTVTGLWYVNLPQEFTMSTKPIKEIEVYNLLYFNENGQLDIGVSCHASFNTDAVENDQMICFCSQNNSLIKSFEIRRNLVGFNMWFKDYKGIIVDQKDRVNDFFILELNLIY